MASVLIDTNILVYAYDRGEYAKQNLSIEVLNTLQVTGSGRLSVQCLAEFFSSTTRGKNPILALRDAVTQVKYLSESFRIYDLTPMIINEAARGVQDHQFSYFDAQIWATAHLNQVSVILSEDFPSRDIIEGVRFVNPFEEGFTLNQWV